MSAIDTICGPLVPAGYHAVPCNVPTCPAVSDNAFESDASITGLIESLEGIADMLCFGTGKLNRTHAMQQCCQLANELTQTALRHAELLHSSITIRVFFACQAGSH